MKDEDGPIICLQFGALAALVVRKEPEAALVVPLEQHHARRRRPVGTRRRQAHRIVQVHAGTARIFVPPPEQRDRVGAGLLLGQPHQRAAAQRQQRFEK